MRFALRLCIAAAVTLGLLSLSATASAQIQVLPEEDGDRTFKIDKLFDDPWEATHSDFAFWGNYAALGWYTATTGGVHLYDISNPASPDEIRNFPCNGNQNDPIFWDRNGNDAPDLMLLAVDRTMDGPACNAPVSNHADGSRFDANPQGWEGVRVFEMSDGSDDYRDGDPFEVIDQVDAQYADCGAHTITANPKFADDPVNPRLVVYVSSYPLRPGPTCGTLLQGLPAGQEPYKNVNNQFEDPSDREVENPLHGVIQVLKVPLDNPAGTTEIAEPEISYRAIPTGSLTGPSAGSPASSRRRSRATTSSCTWRTTSPAAPAPSRARSGRSTPRPGSRTPRTRWRSVTTSSARRHRPVPRSRRLLPLGDVRQRHGDRELGGRVVRQRLPDDDEWQSRPGIPPGRTRPAACSSRTWRGTSRASSMWATLRPDRGGRVLLVAHGHDSDGHQAGPARQRLVHGRGGRDRLHGSERLKEVAYYDSARQTGPGRRTRTPARCSRTGGRAGVRVRRRWDNANAGGMEVYRPTSRSRLRSKGVDHLNPQTMDHGWVATSQSRSTRRGRPRPPSPPSMTGLKPTPKPPTSANASLPRPGGKPVRGPPVGNPCERMARAGNVALFLHMNRLRRPSIDD